MARIADCLVLRGKYGTLVVKTSAVIGYYTLKAPSTGEDGYFILFIQDGRNELVSLEDLPDVKEVLGLI